MIRLILNGLLVAGAMGIGLGVYAKSWWLGGIGGAVVILAWLMK